ncbi:MAG: hypothetical protein WEG36_11045 [Gemmatimonadota bacterium]
MTTVTTTSKRDPGPRPRPTSQAPVAYDVVTRGKLFPRPPFHFDGTFEKPSHFPTTLTRWAPGTFHQSIRINGQLIGLKLSDSTSGVRPSIAVSMFFTRALTRDESELVLQELTFRYALAEDLSAFRTLVYAQKMTTKTVFRRWMGTRASTPYSLYELLVVGLVLQNTHVRRSVQMLAALLDAFGQRLLFDGVALDALWHPQQLEDVGEEELRELRIGYRARALKRFSSQFAAGAIDERALRELDDDELRANLLTIYGVGPETARILRSEAFHRPAAFDHLAPWQQKIYSRLLYGEDGVSARRILRDVRRTFGPYAGLATHVLWEDLFWRHRKAAIPWLAAELRL